MQNPHVNRVHAPAHILGIFGLIGLFIWPSWAWLIGFLLVNLWFSGFGMSVGFHRYFTHRAFKTSKFWHYFMLVGGTLAGQGSVIFWAALHRLHHAKSDTPEDIHTPAIKGFWHAYMGWIFTLDPGMIPMGRASDLIRDPVCKWTHRNYHRILWAWWAFLITLGVILPEARPFIAGVMFAGMVSIHQEAFINSACHTFGSRRFDTKDTSTNIPWATFFTWGQSLHNNHHAKAASASFSQGEPDPGYMLVRVMQKAAV